MGKPRCFPNSMLLSMPRALEHSKVFWLEVLRENKTLDLALLICCSEVLLELKKVEKIALQLFLLALAIRVRSGDFRAISCNRDRSPIFVGHLIVNVSEQSFHVNDEQGAIEVGPQAGGESVSVILIRGPNNGTTSVVSSVELVVKVSLLDPLPLPTSLPLSVPLPLPLPAGCTLITAEVSTHIELLKLSCWLKLYGMLELGGWMKLGGLLELGGWLKLGGLLELGGWLNLGSLLELGGWLKISGLLELGGLLELAAWLEFPSCPIPS
ncbi:hypothetical protein T459_30283 [Capsicum annuum]|uniref:Uncharacterized protein n=1 Tax=Capsicum annuum TaxID=4072 RepID=A0A2G2Y7Z2_CAPAN|nr:hypothetical protein T459_30283 [Capsicum annuum]